MRYDIVSIVNNDTTTIQNATRIMPNFIIVGRRSQWVSTGFAVDAAMAATVVDALNASEEDGDWMAITVPISADCISTTISSWEESGIQ